MELSDAERESLRNMMVTAHMEVMPVGGIERRLTCLPAGARVTVTCSPSKGIDATLEAVKLLSELGFDVVPHLAARQIIDRNHLKGILDVLSDAGVKSIFVPGGDVSPPAGHFDSALQLLHAMSTFEHDITEIGVAVYPEGHPFLDDATLTDVLREKQDFATHCVTQMCFHGKAITNWIEKIRDQDINLPVRIGLPGAIERKKLFAFSLRIGVRDLARVSIKQPRMIGKLMAAKTYQPNDLVLHLASYVESARLNITGLHLYTFNQVEATNDWRESCIRLLDGE